MGTCRRHAIALVALALPLVLAPLGLALSGGQQKLEGTLRTWHGDTFRMPTSVGAGIDTGSALVPLADAGSAVQVLAGKKVRANGQRRGDVFAADGNVQAVAEATATAVAGSKSVAVLLLNFPNNTSQPWTKESVRGVVFDSASSVNAYYQDASYGQLSLTGDVYGWFTIDSTNDGCRYTTWASEARTKATAAAVPLASYQYVVYAFPQATSCNWAGLAYLPGTSSWINGAMNLRVVGHELGHNFGVHHASTLSCMSGSVRTTFSGTCTQSEYGDPFTIMGSASTRHHVNWHRTQLGWFGDVQTVTASGSYTLAAAELANTPRLLRVARGDGTYLNLEYRRPWGTFDNFAPTDPVVNGVSIRIAPGTSSLVQSKLVDATPATTTFSDAALAPGQTVVDPLTGVSITTVSVGASTAVVSIQFSPTPDTQPPVGPSSLSATSPSSTSVQLSWPAATDNVAVAGYRVFRGTTQIATTTALSYLNTALSPATTYTFGVEAFDPSGNTGTRVSATVTTQASGDTSPPVGPSSLSATSPSSTSVQLSWPAATDNVSVAGYRVFRGSTQIATTTALSYLNTALSPSTTYTFGVEAFDAAGNTGTRVSATVTTQASGDTSPPVGPSSLSATSPSSTSVQLSWPAATDNVSVAGYRVFRGSTQIATTTALSYLNTALSPSTTYTFGVEAFDAAGNTGTRVSATVTTQASSDTTPPTTPANLAASPQKGWRVALTWSPSSDNVAVVAYDVFRNGVLVASSSSPSYTDRPGRGTFTYYVRARDAAGNVSGNSATVTVTP